MWPQSTCWSNQWQKWRAWPSHDFMTRRFVLQTCHGLLGKSVVTNGTAGSYTETNWHSSHVWHIDSQPLSMLTHQTLLRNLCLHLTMPWWPSWANCKIRSCSFVGIDIRFPSKITPSHSLNSPLTDLMLVEHLRHLPVLRAFFTACTTSKTSEYDLISCPTTWH